MKVLIVNTSDIAGGAARAAYRLHQSLVGLNIDSKMLVQNKSSDDFTVISDISKICRGINALRPTLDGIPVKWYKNRTKTVFSPAWVPFSNIVEQINNYKPDIVHLHGVCGGMMRIEDIKKINAPLVWTLHDMWAVTGGCRYDENCGAYENQCGNCLVLGSRTDNDLSRKVFIRKEKTYSMISNLTIIALSKWMKLVVKKSALLKNRKVISLPNPIDTDTFKPLDFKAARSLWNLPMDKKLILFGAMGATDDPRKGFQELKSALKSLQYKNLELVVFGSSEPQEKDDLEYKVHYMGHLHDDISLVSLYSAVDLMIVPSLYETFGQTATEAMSCQTPVVAFATTGLIDIIEHKKTGFLAKKFDADDMARGIDWILTTDTYHDLCINSRKKVVQNFDSKLVATQYIHLYKDILNAE